MIKRKLATLDKCGAELAISYAHTCGAMIVSMSTPIVMYVLTTYTDVIDAMSVCQRSWVICVFGQLDN